MSLVEDDTLFFLADAHLDNSVVASLYAFPDVVKIFRIVCGNCNDMVITDYSVKWGFVYSSVSRPGEGICLTVHIAFIESDSVVEFFEFDYPSGLLRSIGANSLEQFKVLVICVDFDLVLCTS